MASPQAAEAADNRNTERRRHTRANVLRPGIIAVDFDREPARGFLIDISENGFGLQSLVPMKPGAARTFAFKPSKESLVTVSGNVVWARELKAGIEISHIDDDSRVALNGWLERMAPTATAQIPSLESGASATVLPIQTSSMPQQPSPSEDELYSIVARARVLTCSNGAAVAWTDPEGMICRASTGDAPGRGVRVQVDRGLSGECIRTTEVVHCEDTETDVRVDPEVCRQLNLRSVAIIPISSNGGVVGLLEVFSSRANAFTPEDLQSLKRLAAECIAPREESREGVTASLKGFESAPNGAPVRRDPNLKFKIIVPLVVGTGLLLGGAKLANRKSASAASREADTPQLVKQSVAMPQSDDSGVASTAGEMPASPAQPLHRSKRGGSSSRPDRNSSTPQPQAAGTEDVGVDAQAAANKAEADVQAPALSAQAGGADDKLVSMLNVPANRNPVLSPTSQPSEVTPAKLVHRVAPRYPEAARLAKKQGTVVLNVTITEAGRVKNVKVIEGDADLVQAAVSAVKQWRYEPYRLNGKPLDVDAEVRIGFALSDVRPQ